MHLAHLSIGNLLLSYNGRTILIRIHDDLEKIVKVEMTPGTKLMSKKLVDTIRMKHETITIKTKNGKIIPLLLKSNPVIFKKNKDEKYYESISMPKQFGQNNDILKINDVQEYQKTLEKIGLNENSKVSPIMHKQDVNISKNIVQKMNEEGFIYPEESNETKILISAQLNETNIEDDRYSNISISAQKEHESKTLMWERKDLEECFRSNTTSKNIFQTRPQEESADTEMFVITQNDNMKNKSTKIVHKKLQKRNMQAKISLHKKLDDNESKAQMLLYKDIKDIHENKIKTGNLQLKKISYLQKEQLGKIFELNKPQFNFEPKIKDEGAIQRKEVINLPNYAKILNIHNSLQENTHLTAQEYIEQPNILLDNDVENKHLIASCGNNSLTKCITMDDTADKIIENNGNINFFSTEDNFHLNEKVNIVQNITRYNKIVDVPMLQNELQDFIRNENKLNLIDDNSTFDESKQLIIKQNVINKNNVNESNNVIILQNESYENNDHKNVIILQNLVDKSRKGITSSNLDECVENTENKNTILMQNFVESNFDKMQSNNQPKILENVSLKGEYEVTEMKKLITVKNIPNEIVKSSSKFNLICEICGRKFLNQNKYENHKKQMHSDNTFKCPTCGKLLKTAGSLQKHLKIHKGLKFSCGLCGLSLASKNALEIHTRRHNGEYTHICTECGKEYYNSKSFNHHFEAEHAGIRYPCEICGSVLKSKRYYRDHMMNHSNKEARTFKCTICHKYYSTKSALNEHTRIHSGKRYVCHICGKKSIQKGAHDGHMRMHSGEKTFICELCGKNFVRKDVLEQHMRKIHETTKISCVKCGKIFKSVHQLMGHLHTHDEVEKPFPCLLCDKKFIDKNFLRNHVNCVHVEAKSDKIKNLKMKTSKNTSDKMLYCLLCKETFSSNISLKYHKESVHLNPSAGSCQECKISFIDNDELAAHMSKTHAEVSGSFLKSKRNKDFIDSVSNMQIHDLMSTMSTLSTQRSSLNKPHDQSYSGSSPVNNFLTQQDLIISHANDLTNSNEEYLKDVGYQRILIENEDDAPYANQEIVVKEFVY